jgi:hypothetical protein
VRFKHGGTAYGHTLQLGFVALTAAQAKLLRDHYREQDGSYTSFPLSAEAWAGHTSFEDLVPATTYWRYASQPEETHRLGGYVDVSITMLSVPAIVNGYAPGVARSIAASIVGGAASGS